MKIFNFWANWVDFGIYKADTEEEAKNNFASDAGYLSWDDMVNRTAIFGKNEIEFKEMTNMMGKTGNMKP